MLISTPRSARPAVALPINLLALNPEDMERMVSDLGWPRYRSHQILRWLYRQRVRHIEQMTTLSHRERAQLSAKTYIGRFARCECATSEDGTKKFVAGLDDGLSVETVLIPDVDRVTLCLSTQVGCTLDCRFCLTGQMGLNRNLKAHEIVDQVLTVQDHLGPGTRFSNLVMMGMGEPLANFAEVAAAVTRVTDEAWGLGIPARRITLSTAGLAPRLKDAAALGVNLAVSLNASTDALRGRLMPAINRLYPLKVLLKACRDIPLPPRQRLTFEYVLLADVNDSREDAKLLSRLVAGMRCKINLIPFNEFPGSPFRRPQDSTVLAFQAVLREAGLDAFIRKSKGRDVLGACGQLGNLPNRRHVDVPFAVGACSS